MLQDASVGHNSELLDISSGSKVRSKSSVESLQPGWWSRTIVHVSCSNLDLMRDTLTSTTIAITIAVCRIFTESPDTAIGKNLQK